MTRLRTRAFMQSLLFTFGLISIAAAMNTPVLHAQGGKPAAPVDISSDPLPLKQNEQGMLQIHVVALAPADQLEVRITASTGVVLARPMPVAMFRNVKGGERHNLQVAVRLTAATFGYVAAVAITTRSSDVETRSRTLVVGTVPPPPDRVPVGLDQDLADLTLVRIGGINAVVKFGDKPLVVVKEGDRLGRNKAELVQIAPDHIVLDEAFTGADGRPNRARVTLKEGETGGTRVTFRPGEEPPPIQRLRVVPQNEAPAPK